MPSIFTLYLEKPDGRAEALSTHDSLKEACSFKRLLIADREFHKRGVAFFVLDQTGHKVASHAVGQPSRLASS
jgi:hypothetical protein